MRTLPISATDDEIRALVVAWSELFAQKRFREALEMLPHSNDDHDWTPETLAQVITGYGVFAPYPETIESLLRHHGVPCFEITTLLGRADRDEIVAKIDVDRKHLFGLDPQHYSGMVHYEDVPLSGFRSDLTAQFHIERVGFDTITLEFLNLHVM